MRSVQTFGAKNEQSGKSYENQQEENTEFNDIF